MHGPGLSSPNVDQRGFSLVEVMVSLAILLAGVGGMAIAFQNHIYQSVASKNQAQAAVIAESILAEMASTDVTLWSPTAMEDHYNFDYEGNLVDKDDDGVYYTTSIESVDQPGYKQITIGVNWTGWKNEQGTTGFMGKGGDPTFAYVLEAALSTQSGIEE